MKKKKTTKVRTTYKVVFKGKVNDEVLQVARDSWDEFMQIMETRMNDQLSSGKDQTVFVKVSKVNN